MTHVAYLNLLQGCCDRIKIGVRQPVHLVTTYLQFQLRCSTELVPAIRSVIGGGAMRRRRIAGKFVKLHPNERGGDPQRLVDRERRPAFQNKMRWEMLVETRGGAAKIPLQLAASLSRQTVKHSIL